MKILLIFGLPSLGVPERATMTGMPDHTDQRELLRKFLGEGRPATPEAVAQVVEAGAAGHRFGQTRRDRTADPAFVEVVLGLRNTLPAGLEHMMRQPGSARQAEGSSWAPPRDQS
jgi:hypothetical protein